MDTERDAGLERVRRAWRSRDVATLLAEAQQPQPAVVRDMAIHYVGKLRSHDAVHDLCALLRDESRDVRVFAAKALGQIGNEKAAGSLADAVQRDPERLVRLWAVDSLAKLGSASDANAAIRFLQDAQTWQERWAAVRALVSAADPVGVKPVSEVASRERNPIRKARLYKKLFALRRSVRGESRDR